MRVVLLVLGLLFAVGLKAQDAKLAGQYFNDGEYEKAAVLYQKLYDKTKSNYYFDNYIKSLIAVEDYTQAESAIKKELKAHPDRVQLYVTYGKIYEAQFEDEKAQKQFRKAIDNLPNDQYQISRLASAFISMPRYDEALEVYEKGSKLLKDDLIFAYNLGDLYRRKGDSQKMIHYYLNSLQHNPSRMNSLKSLFQRNFTDEDYQNLQTDLYTRVQEDENEVVYVEFLSWCFIQKKDYKNALRQVRALDRRLGENGARVFKLGNIAANAGDFDTAISAYKHIIEKKGVGSPYYIDAKQNYLLARRDKLTSNINYTQEELKLLADEYGQFLDEFGRNGSTAAIMLEEAELYAFYINDLDAAIERLNAIVQIGALEKELKAEAKMRLADFYLMQANRWEATLLYSQVDKDFAEGILGHEARFKNAKLAYYFGDFEWAQAQFDVLKASTSKLIANDALDLSVFIMDNYGLDTSATALQMYAETDLLVFQNRFDEAFVKMDSLLTLFPQHTLEDDVWYLTAQIYKKQKKYQEAEKMYMAILDTYVEEIRADNALFEWAEMKEVYMNQPEEAKKLYERLFLEFSNSTFAIEARKRYRRLRGDDI